MNWVSQAMGQVNWIYSVYFIDNNTGWTAGRLGNIYKTTDCGVSWISQSSSTNNALHSVYFINKDSGWIAGENSTILHTTDGGSNWLNQVNSSNSHLLSVHFIDYDNGWVAGYNGTVLHTTNGGITSIDDNNQMNPIEFILSQNYPNPFNPVTKIKYSIPSATLRQAQSDIKITLKVYDVLGKEIATLVNEAKPAGTYEVEFDASDLTSGIYFYQLKAGDFVETKKMVLLR